MKGKFKLSLLAATVAAVVAGCSPLAFAQAAIAPAGRWAGTWEGKRDGLPSVVLRITGDGRAVQGQADFYILIKVDGGAPTADDKMTVAMLHPQIQGDTLGFQVMRVNRSGNRADNTILNFSLRPAGNRSATLKRTGGGEPDIEVAMVRVQ